MQQDVWQTLSGPFDKATTVKPHTKKHEGSSRCTKGCSLNQIATNTPLEVEIFPATIEMPQNLQVKQECAQLRQPLPGELHGVHKGHLSC